MGKSFIIDATEGEQIGADAIITFGINSSAQCCRVAYLKSGIVTSTDFDNMLQVSRSNDLKYLTCTTDC